MNKRLKIWGTVPLAVAALITAALLILGRWANRPADGTLHTGMPAAQDTVATETPKEPVTIDTDYFAARLPAGFKIKRQDTDPHGPIRLHLVANDKHQQLAITIAELPSDGLSGVSSYKLRTTDSTSYQPYRPSGMPVAATAFRALNDPSAFVAFWPNSSLYAEIALTSDGAASLSDLLNTFIQTTPTWEWR